MGGTAVTTAQEIRVVALLAKGYTQKQIQGDMVATYNRTIDQDTITAIKKRNYDNLNMIKQKLLQIEQADALSIHSKANKLLKDKLNSADDEQRLMAEANADILSGAITLNEYYARTKHIKTLTVSELVTVSKEMFVQQRAEVEPPPMEQNNINELLKAIQSGDTTILERIIFNADSGTPTAESVPPIRISQDIRADNSSTESSASNGV